MQGPVVHSNSEEDDEQEQQTCPWGCKLGKDGVNGDVEPCARLHAVLCRPLPLFHT